MSPHKTIKILLLCTLLLLMTIIFLPTHASAAVLNFTSIFFTDLNGGTIDVNTSNLTTVYCNGSIINSEGIADITKVNASIWGPSSNNSGAPSAGLKYTNTTCSLTAVNTTNITYNCRFYTHHNMQPGTWTCNITGFDAQGNSTSSTTATVGTTRSIGVYNTSLDFGDYVQAGNSSNKDTILKIYNNGNVYFRIIIDAYRVSGTPAAPNAFTCTTGGNMPVGSIRFNISAGVDVSLKSAMTNAPITVTQNYTSTPYGSTYYNNGSLYLGMIIPAGYRGTCNGFFSVTATT